MEILDYNIFSEKCVEELKALQDKFQHKYNVDQYADWFSAARQYFITPTIKH
ncbi:MAG: hypothetical protein WKF85_07390 [Chitinophagaceae bacterium]